MGCKKLLYITDCFAYFFNDSQNLMLGQMKSPLWKLKNLTLNKSELKENWDRRALSIDGLSQAAKVDLFFFAYTIWCYWIENLRSICLWTQSIDYESNCDGSILWIQGNIWHYIKIREVEHQANSKWRSKPIVLGVDSWVCF